MSVRVNLLPSEVGERNAARRLQLAAAGAGAAVLVGLAGLYLWQVGQVNEANELLATEQAEVQRLQAEVNDLSEFQRLADQGVVLDQIIVALLGGEASLAGVLQDLAAVMPSDTSINALGISVSPDGTGTVTTSAVSLLGYTPGLERVLIALEKVASFENVFFGGSAIAPDSGVASFSLTFDLTQLILTNRYTDGFPEVLR